MFASKLKYGHADSVENSHCRQFVFALVHVMLDRLTPRKYTIHEFPRTTPQAKYDFRHCPQISGLASRLSSATTD